MVQAGDEESLDKGGNMIPGSSVLPEGGGLWLVQQGDQGSCGSDPSPGEEGAEQQKQDFDSHPVLPGTTSHPGKETGPAGSKGVTP